MTDPETLAARLVPADAPVLRRRARELTDRERAHKADRLIKHLFTTMLAHHGAGLAAPQIGELLRVFVMGNESFVNPVIQERSAETVVYEEGCLSLPGILVDVRRNVTITLQTAGRIVRLTGQSARVAQHEIDHLDGRLITDYAGARGVQYAPREPNATLDRALADGLLANSDREWQVEAVRLALDKRLRDYDFTIRDGTYPRDLAEIAVDTLARGRPEGPSAPACNGPNSHAEYNSLVATAEDLANENERFRAALQDVALVAGGKAAERIRDLLRGSRTPEDT